MTPRTRPLAQSGALVLWRQSFSLASEGWRLCLCLLSDYREQGFNIHLEKGRQMWTSVRGTAPSPASLIRIDTKAGEKHDDSQGPGSVQRERARAFRAGLHLLVHLRWGEVQVGAQGHPGWASAERRPAGAGGQRCVRGNERHPERVLAGRQLQPEPAARFSHTHTRPLVRAHGAAQKPGGGKAGRGVT